jgi:pimeloyl-ACP methyl ester carboxylesterase
MAAWAHRYAPVNGLTMHYVEQGEGTLLVLCHGFPHTWFSWHRQIGALAAAGWRVVAPDMRGMGRTTAPTDFREYDCEHIVGDLTGLLDHLGEDRAVFAGLDFGVLAIYDLAYRHPERVAAIIGLENPHWPDRPDQTPLAEAAEWSREHFVHIHDFVSRPDSHVRLDADPREFLKRVYYALSADYHYLDVWKHPPGTEYLDALPEAPPLPWPWLSEPELEFIVADYAASGFAGGINWYRAMDLRWHQRTPLRGKKCAVPFYFIGSVHDVDLEAWHGDDPIAEIANQYEDVRRIEMIERAGHLMQLERSEAVTGLMLEFLADIWGRSS